MIIERGVNVIYIGILLDSTDRICDPDVFDRIVNVPQKS